jgi:hypothetical protein
MAPVVIRNEDASGHLEDQVQPRAEEVDRPAIMGMPPILSSLQRLDGPPTRDSVIVPVRWLR